MDYNLYYWIESLIGLLDEMDITLNTDKIKKLAEGVMGISEMESQACGYDVIGVGAKSAAETELEEIKQQVEKQRQWEASTKPCPDCLTNGTTLDRWGRPQECCNCGGKGRI